MKNKQKKSVSSSLYPLFITQMVILIGLLISFFVEMNELLYLLLCMIIVLSLFLFYQLYRVIVKMQKQAEQEAELLFLKQQEKIQEEHQLLNTVLSNDITSIHEELAADFKYKKKSRKITDLRKKYAGLLSIGYSKNKIIDAILFHKFLIAEHYQIHYEAIMYVPETIDIEPVHIMCVFGNLLDNAIEACRQLPQEDRWLRIEAEVKANYLVVTCENSKSTMYQVAVEGMKSTKQDAEHHGFGLAQMKHICEEQDGFFDIEDLQDHILIRASMKQAA